MACYRVELTDRALTHFRGHIDYIVNELRNPDAAPVECPGAGHRRAG